MSLVNKNRKKGSIIQDEEGNKVPIFAINVIFNEVLEEVKNEKKKFIGEYVGIEEEYYIHRSLRLGSTTQASNKEVSELEITAANM